jgi:hypothetical protein
MKILIDDEYTGRARSLLKAGFHMRGHNRDNPVTGTTFAHGLDPIVWQIRDAARALRARDRFARENPELPPLPLCPSEWERPKSGQAAFHIEHALGMFGRSLASHHCCFDLDRHPSFEAYMRGFLCSRRLREMFAPVAYLFPPKPLPGLVPGYSYWGPPGRLSYLDELVHASETEMEEWPEGWLTPELQIHADWLKARKSPKSNANGART